MTLVQTKDNYDNIYDHLYTLFDFIKRGKENQFLEYLSSLSQDDINVNFRDANGNYLITFAIIKNNTTIVKKLIDYGSRLDIIDNGGKSILYYPIKYSYISLLDTLLEFDKKTIGISIVNLKDSDESFPLTYAIKFNNSHAVQELLSNGADPNYQLNNKMNALHSAILSNNIVIIKMVSRYINDIDAQDKNGWTALHYACSMSSLEIIKILLSYHISLNISNYEYEFTPIFYSVIQNDIDICKFLITDAIDINHQDRYGDTIIHHSIRWKHDEIFDHIMLSFEIEKYSTKYSDEHLSQSKFTNRINPSLVNINGQTIGHMILYDYRDYYKKYLPNIIEKSNLNYQDNIGNTIMHLLIELDIWKQYSSILETKKINITIKNNKKQTILNIVHAHDRSYFIEIISKGYYDYLKKHPNGWLEKWQNECSQKNITNESEKKCIKLIIKSIQSSKSIFPTKLNKKTIAIDLDENIEYTTFVGYTIDIIIGYKYLCDKYKNITTLINKFYYNNKSNSIEELLEALEIQWYFQELKLPINFEQILTNIIKNKKYQFIVIPIGIIQSNGNHSNSILIDTSNSEIERFEPHGAGYPTDYNYNPNLLDDLLEKLLKNIYYKINPSQSVKYFNPMSYIPKIGFQKMDNAELNINKNIGDPDGFCNLWNIWYVDYRIKYSHIDRKKLIRHIFKIIASNMYSFRTTIRNYSKKITDIRDFYLTQIGSNINDSINNRIPANKLAELSKLITN